MSPRVDGVFMITCESTRLARVLRRRRSTQGTGNNNKINWALTNTQELIDLIETVYRGARKGRGLVVSPKDYSTKYRY